MKMDKDIINKSKKTNFSIVWNDVKKHSRDILLYLVVILILVYVYYSYNSKFICWYKDCVIPLLTNIKTNVWFSLIASVLILIVVCDIKNKIKVRYRFGNIILLLFPIAIELLICRLSANFSYDTFIGFISYVDIIMLICFVYPICELVNTIRSYLLRIEKNKATNNDDNFPLTDRAINNDDEDSLNMKMEAKEVAKQIESCNIDNMQSIAITAQWGAGKTSFMNLILSNISLEEFEIVRFAPRNSKSVGVIQEDFFSQIASMLSKYDARCSNTIKKYMIALQLVDEHNIIKKYIDSCVVIYNVLKKDKLKSSIEDTFVSLKKKVLVYIDDFDRLTKEEILEVLKLIDSNAAFPNLIFLTAYDKAQVNRIFGDFSNSKDACFIDKFFNWEYAIPYRPYEIITDCLKKHLFKMLDATDADKSLIDAFIRKNSDKLLEYIPTLRDAKRFINQFVFDFKNVKGDVIMDEYLWVQLIKYKYPESYKDLYKGEFFEKSGKIMNGNNGLILNRNSLLSTKNRQVFFEIIEI